MYHELNFDTLAYCNIFLSQSRTSLFSINMAISETTIQKLLTNLTLKNYFIQISIIPTVKLFSVYENSISVNPHINVLHCTDD